MEKVKLEANREEYSERTIELLAIIGECFLGFDTPDERYFKRKLQRALNELELEEE